MRQVFLLLLFAASVVASPPVHLRDDRRVAALRQLRGKISAHAKSELCQRAEKQSQQEIVKVGKDGKKVEVKPVPTMPPVRRQQNYTEPPAPPKNTRRVTELQANRNISDLLYQGDILLSLEEIEAKLAEYEQEETGKKKAPRSKRGILSSSPNWDPDTPIAYYFDPAFPAEGRKMVRQAFDNWQQVTCLTFQEDGQTAPRIRVFRGDGCYSVLGRWAYGPTQDLSIGQGCDSIAIIMHEIGHALGLVHTQARPDRDNYVTIDFDNINPTYAGNYEKATRAQTQGNPYDYGSVMHYPAYGWGFAIDETKPVIAATDKFSQSWMGQREEAAFSDVAMINKFYNCKDKCAKSTHRCYNGGVINPKTCNTCVCPVYFDGPSCDVYSRNSNGTLAANLQWNPEVGHNWTWHHSVDGKKDYNVYEQANVAYYVIKAPAGKQVELSLVHTGNYCQAQCAFQGVEINLGHWDVRGKLLCCADQYFEERLRSVGDRIVIRTYTKYFLVELAFWFRYV